MKNWVAIIFEIQNMILFQNFMNIHEWTKTLAVWKEDECKIFWNDKVRLPKVYFKEIFETLENLLQCFIWLINDIIEKKKAANLYCCLFAILIINKLINGKDQKRLGKWATVMCENQ